MKLLCGCAVVLLSTGAFAQDAGTPRRARGRSAAVAPQPAAERKPFEWPMPNLLRRVDVPETLKVEGIPTRIRAVLLKVGADQLLQMYADAFTAADFYIPPMRHQPRVLREPMLTAFDPRRGISYTVILQPIDNGTTTVILGEANLALRDKPGEDVAPLYPGASQPLRTEQEGATLLAYEVSAKVADVERFYKEALGKAGFAPSEEPGEAGVYKRQGEVLQVRARERGAVTSVVVIRSAH